MEKKKDIIEIIVEKLKNQAEGDYREGAWEKFQQKNAVSKPAKTIQLRKWASIAAACLLFGGIGIYFYNNTSTTVENTLATTASKNSNPVSSNSTIRTEDSTKTEGDQNPVIASRPNELDNTTSVKTDQLTRQSAMVYTQAPTLANPPSLLTIDRINATQHIEKQLNIKKPTAIPTSHAPEKLNPSKIEMQRFILASTANSVGHIAVKEVENINQSKSIKLGQKIDLGLYVSPQGTSEKTNVGAGVLLAYNLTSKISLRTGASYNTYSAGQLKNPNETSSVEAVAVSSIMSNEMAYNSLSMNKIASSQANIFVPNINAVTGFVKSVDIPLEVKYSVSKSLYATAGASYSAIVNQGREAQYIENMNTETFANGFPSNDSEMQRATQAVTRTVKSAEKNVNTNGFSGFVNFSVGQKVNIKNRIGLAIEPYIKLPVGQFRKSDMDYTNGGIRIMTSF